MQANTTWACGASSWVAIGAMLVALGCDAGSERINETAGARADERAGQAGAGQDDRGAAGKGSVEPVLSRS